MCLTFERIWFNKIIVNTYCSECPDLYFIISNTGQIGIRIHFLSNLVYMKFPFIIVYSFMHKSIDHLFVQLTG